MVVWRCRVLSHAALEQRLTGWRRGQGRRGTSATRCQQEAEVKDLRAAFPDYAALHRHVLQDVLARLDTTYHTFFRRLANGEKPGFPRCKPATRSTSFTDQESGNGAHLDHGYLVLAQSGRSAVRWSRPIAGTIKTITLWREADGWSVSFACVEVPCAPLPLTGKETGREAGTDVGLKGCLTTAEDAVVENPRHYRKAEKQLAKAQKRLSRRKKRSTRWYKAARLLAKNQKNHQQVRRQRRDVHHKTALALVRQYDVISAEAIQSAHRGRRPAPVPDGGNGGYLHTRAKAKSGVNTSIQDAGWGHFLTILACKAAWAGKRVDVVNPAYTSQECSGGGERVEQSLAVRTHVCPNCGLMLDRDEHAARTIFWRGQRLRGVAGMPAALNREPVGL